MKNIVLLVFAALLILPFERGSAQLSDLKKVARYEATRLDKANALAWSLFCPGGGQIYAGDVLNGFGSLLVNGYLTYSYIDAIDKREWGRARTNLFLGLLGRIADVSLAFSAVDDHNQRLRVSLGITASLNGSRPQPVLAINVKF